jgi:hypothetical protein
LQPEVVELGACECPPLWQALVYHIFQLFSKMLNQLTNETANEIIRLISHELITDCDYYLWHWFLSKDSKVLRVISQVPDYKKPAELFAKGPVIDFELLAKSAGK